MSKTTWISRTRGCLLVSAIMAAVCLVWPLPAPAAEPAEAAKPAAAAKLVQAAMENELAGRDDQRQALLDEALHQSPGCQPAHWHSGQVLEGGKWQRPEEVERHARQDSRLAEFKRRRAEVKDLAGCVALARWCHKNGLADQERVAWQAVLLIEPDHAERYSSCWPLGCWPGCRRRRRAPSRLPPRRGSWRRTRRQPISTPFP